MSEQSWTEFNATANGNSAAIQPQTEADKSKEENVNVERPAEERTFPVEELHPQSSIPKPSEFVDEVETVTLNQPKPVPKQHTQTENVTVSGMNIQSNPPTLTCRVACDFKKVGQDLSSGKKKIPLPLILHLNCRSHTVTMATLISSTSSTIRPVKMKNGQTEIIGAIAYLESENKFYYGINAVQIKMSKNDIHFHDIFGLLLLKDKKSMQSETALRNFFEFLKTELEDEGNFRFNRAIIVLPDWLKDENKNYLEEFLCPSLFQNVTCHEESVVIAAGYFQELFKKQRQMQTPILLAIGSQPPLVIVLESFGFIHVKLVLCYKEDDDVDKIDSIIHKAVLVHNEEKKRKKTESDADIKWSWNDEEKILRSGGNSPDVKAAKKLYHKACENFVTVCNNEHMNDWIEQKKNHIVVTENSEWKNIILKMVSENKNAEVDDLMPSWNQLALQGAAIYCFDGTEEFNYHLTAEMKNVDRMDSTTKGDKSKFRSVTLQHDDKRSPDVFQKALELFKVCDEFISFTQSHCFRDETRLFVDYLCERIANAQLCAQTSESIGNVLAEIRKIYILRESLNDRVVENCSATNNKL